VRNKLEKEKKIIKVNVVYGNEKLVECMKKVIRKHIKE